MMKSANVYQRKNRFAAITSSPAHLNRGGMTSLSRGRGQQAAAFNVHNKNAETYPFAVPRNGLNSSTNPSSLGSHGQVLELRMYEEYYGSSGSATLGSGCFGTVKRYRHVVTSKVIAIKIVQKNFLIEHKMMDQMLREIQIHSTLKHPNIVSYIGHCDTSQAFYLGMEYANGGHLFKKLRDSGKFSFRRTAYYLKQVLAALVKLHALGLIHRDLKPENLLLFVDDDGSEVLKLSDFGWSNEALYRKSIAMGHGQTPQNEVRKTFCGTREYLSPEMLLAEPHGFALDLWSVGVLAYEMLTGNAPFEGLSIFSKILDGSVEFPPGLDTDAVHFIKLLLRRNPAERPTAMQALRHPFIAKFLGPRHEDAEGRRPNPPPRKNGERFSRYLDIPSCDVHLRQGDADHGPQTASSSALYKPPNSTSAPLHSPATDGSETHRSRNTDHPSGNFVNDHHYSYQITRNDNRQLKSKLQLLQNKYEVNLEKFVTLENELDEQKALIDRLLLTIGPTIKQCLSLVGSSNASFRGNESGDVIAMVSKLFATLQTRSHLRSVNPSPGVVSPVSSGHSAHEHSSSSPKSITVDIARNRSLEVEYNESNRILFNTSLFHDDPGSDGSSMEPPEGIHYSKTPDSSFARNQAPVIASTTSHPIPTTNSNLESNPNSSNRFTGATSTRISTLPLSSSRTLRRKKIIQGMRSQKSSPRGPVSQQKYQLIRGNSSVNVGGTPMGLIEGNTNVLASQAAVASSTNAYYKRSKTSQGITLSDDLSDQLLSYTSDYTHLDDFYSDDYSVSDWSSPTSPERRNFTGTATARHHVVPPMIDVNGATIKPDMRTHHLISSTVVSVGPVRRMANPSSTWK